eukprot:scaffold359_cov76-Cyclotella_meneghiniana.AAC.2
MGRNPRHLHISLSDISDDVEMGWMRSTSPKLVVLLERLLYVVSLQYRLRRVGGGGSDDYFMMMMSDEI